MMEWLLSLGMVCSSYYVCIFLPSCIFRCSHFLFDWYFYISISVVYVAF